MESEFFQDAVDQVGPTVGVVDLVEDITGGVHRQRGEVQTLAIWGNGGDTGCDAKANVAEPTQFLHYGIDLLSAHSMRVENIFRVIEDYHHLL